MSHDVSQLMQQCVTLYSLTMDEVSCSFSVVHSKVVQSALAPPPSENVTKCFCASVITAKRSVDELFMHCFHN